MESTLLKSALKKNRSLSAAAALAALALLAPAGPAGAAAGPMPSAASKAGSVNQGHAAGLVLGVLPRDAAKPAPTLDLGAADLPESRSVTTLAPGVTRTSISRGAANPALSWTAEVTIPSSDPAVSASALSDEPTARSVAAQLTAAGVAARMERVMSPELADAGGDLGFRVRAGEFGSREAAADTVARIKTSGYSSSVWYTGWDGDAGSVDQSRGPWNLEVLTIDPKEFDGELAATFGADLEKRETTSQLAAASGALAAVNAGFFVFDPKAGAEGDPAGAGVYSGQVLSEAVGDRPALVIDGKKAEADVERLTWRGTVSAGGDVLPLDGINRVPGLIRNCGGTPDDVVTSRPLHDVTCTDADEIVSFSPEFGATTPAGPGMEVVLDASGHVTAVNGSRGTSVPAGGASIQAIGAEIERLSALAKPGATLKVTSDLVDADGKQLMPGSSSHVVNGGPMLVRNGGMEVTAQRDGMVHQTNPGMFYGWAHKRNPRTIAGTDAAGRVVLVTADGRQTDSLGLSLQESAQVAKSLGLTDAINLDGGGSTTMVAKGAVVNTPSNTGSVERAVGDAIVVLPSRKTFER
ncbi:phosphodiester glycosidase family protein [Pseudarthrobacter sp. SSS035]|uniref:phosphodiester glycosidase family protein n=1 Tax=Pseudarthrobacter sp. SSS035 TaxID=2931399 RepID=UPI00200E68CE|nr:phosphodiester glycosidase family protein [Pseudarthrobacter sp. SSS035]